MTKLVKDLESTMERVTKGEGGSIGTIIKLLMLLCRAIILNEK
jgi:hypothetical protein